MAPEEKKRLLGGGILLLVTIAAAVMLVTGLHVMNKNTIEYNIQRAELNFINPILPDGADGDIFSTLFTIRGHDDLGLAKQLTVFRIMQDNKQTGIVLLPVVTSGYNGPVALALGIMQDGGITGVRVITHNETKGLGDGIDHLVSDWILNFTDRSLANTPDEAWAIHNEDGEFDQLSGATITSRTVINAVHKALNYYAANQQLFYRR